MKKNIIAGFNVVCVGDNNNYSYLPSRNGNSYSDIIAKHILKNTYPKYKTFNIQMQKNFFAKSNSCCVSKI